MGSCSSTRTCRSSTRRSPAPSSSRSSPPSSWAGAVRTCSTCTTNPSVAAAMTYQGKRYGLPYYTDSQGLVYNTDILRRAGISTPPRTLDELEAQALRIKAAGLLEYPIGLAAQLSDTAMMWIWALVHANESDLFDRSQPVMGRSGSAFVAILEWLQRATQRSRVLDPASIQTLPVPLDNAMMAGRYAFTLAPRYSLRNYNNPEKSTTAGAMLLAGVPSLDGRTEGTASTARMYCLKRETEVRDKAIRLLNYLGGFDEHGVPYTAKFWFLQRGLGFAYDALRSDSEVDTTLRKFADPTAYAYLAEVSRARSILSVPWYAEFEAALQRTVQRVLTGGTAPREAAAELDRAAASLANRYA
ncbi:extracellular solute-binding protein [Saccharopolyspora sp. 5N708]|uniref:extracellular solute-binding protein n=1 Tax=Saccharopolyspora sp. 5N708 TaxID=3457424 RepID=UPI003FD17A53